MCLSRRIDGAVAQLGERGLCKPEVVGSNPISSTTASEKCGELSGRSQLFESDRVDLRDALGGNRTDANTLRVTRPQTGRVRTVGPSDRSLTVESLSGSKRSMRLVHASGSGGRDSR